MNIVVIGGTGLIGSKLVKKLRADGHHPLAASPDTGVDVITGKGLAGALAGARVVVDVSNAPDGGDAAVMDFFQTSARSILAAEAAAGVGYHVALSVVGTDRLQGSGYFRAKLAQEEALKAAAVPRHPVIAAASPPLSPAVGAAAVGGLPRAVDGPVVLAGHSYGGMVITGVPADACEITGLVYVCAFAPEPGDTCNALAARFPGSTLGQALRPVRRGAGTTGPYIVTERFHAQFCADVPAPEAARMAATQDRDIPAALQRFMAQRASARWRFPARRTRSPSHTPRRQPG